ncbi:MAG TPA: ferredoxin reductase family protein [Candidatus Doudnabacteria bacterium]|nr:ferredoxin reductase family protein [Candidatus Doudnabacteria bacterium]
MNKTVQRIIIYSLLIVNYLILLGFWWVYSGDLFSSPSLSGPLLALGRVAGLLGAIQILLQLILIGRVKWVETAFGLDKLSRLHRWNGYLILGLIVAHPILITQAYAIINSTTYAGQYIDFLKNWDTLLRAFAGYIILLATIGLSITIIRRRLKYETWYYVHLLNYIAIALIFGHQLRFGTDAQGWWFRGYWYFVYGFAFGNLIWYRFLRPLLKFTKHDFHISRVEPEDPNGIATSVYITGDKIRNFKIKAGQFAIFRFFQRGFWTQAHPFSFSMIPKNGELRLTAKKLGDYTNLMPHLTPGVEVLIDGPHGRFTEEVITKDKLLFIAGGIGITPIRALLESLGPQEKHIILLYANKSPAEKIFAEELAELSYLHDIKIIDIYSDERIAGAQFGRLDQAMLHQLVPDLTERDVFLCGPPPMMDALKKALKNLGLPKKQFHWERFAL